MKEKIKVCPLLASEGIDVECELINKYYCPYSSIPHMQRALELDLPDCPLSWQLDEDLEHEERGDK